MYVGVVTILMGEVLISGSALLTWYALGFFVCANVFIIGVEEPSLERLFGEAYLEYKTNVRRWVPRLTPWTPRRQATRALTI